MNLFQTIDNIKKIALVQPNVRTAIEGNVYSIMNNTPDLQYGVVVITQGTHRSDEMFNYFNFNIFYIDRLVDDMESNRLQIQSIGIQILNNIINTFADEYDIDLSSDVQYNPFTQKFADETAGDYISITLEVPKDSCAESYVEKVPVKIYNTKIETTFTENGEYKINYDKDIYTGIEEVNVVVEVDTTDAYNEGKADGFQEGIEQGRADGIEEGIEQGKIIGREEGKVIGREEAIESLPSLVVNENGTYEGAYKNIEVNVPQTAKISVKESGIKFGNATFTTVPDIFDFSGVIDMSYMFADCGNLQTIPHMDTSETTNMSNMFYYSGIKTIPAIDTRNVTNMNRMFSYSNIESLPEFDCTSLTNIERIFQSAGDKLTECGGWKNLKINWTDNYGLARCQNLSYQSCINILNGLADVTELGGRTLKVHSNFLTTVGEDINKGINKGWTITA